MTKKLPAILFYPGDWRRDPGIMPLDLMHRGLWFEILLLMHESPERGVLLTANRDPMPIPMLAAMFNIDPILTSGMVDVLVEYGVASRREDGALINRRMIRDNEGRAALIERRRESGRMGAEARWKPKDPIAPAIVLPKTCHDKEMAGHGYSSSSSSSFSLTSSKEKSKSPAKKIAGYTPEFEAWWKIYPARPGKSKGNKGEALSEWNKLPEGHQTLVMTASATLAAQVSRDPSTLPKDAQRFLRAPNKSAGADPSYMEWLNVEPAAPKQRLNDKNIIPGSEQHDLLEDTL